MPDHAPQRTAIDAGTTSRRRAARPTSSLATVAVASLLGCAGEPPADPVTVRDSAGVAIVESRAPRWGSGEAWIVGPDATVRIGVAGGAAGYELSDVAGAVRTADGRIAIADGGSLEVRLFDAGGTLLRTVGGRGDGPGEFSVLAGIGADGRGGIWVWDVFLRRLTRLGAAGEVTGVETLPPEPPALRAVGMLSDGSLVLRQLWGVRSVASATEAGLRRDPVAWVRAEAGDPTPDTIALVPGREIALSSEDGRAVMSTVPFGRDAVGAVGGDRVLTGSQVDFEIDVRAPDGTLTRRIRIPGRDLALTDADVAAFRDARLRDASPQERPAVERWLADTPLPDRRPAHGDILVDAGGAIWVGSWVPTGAPPSWTVFEADGGWLGEVSMPESFRPLDIGDDWILGVERDELDVERVALYPLVKQR